MEIREEHIEVVRTARYAVAGAAAPRALWVVCHGYRQLAARFLRRFRALDDGSRLVVAPEALSRFYLDADGGPHGPDSRVGATWMTREDRENEIRDYVRYLDALHARVLAELRRPPEQIVALGFSQGAATACRWAAIGGTRVDHLVLWAGAPPPDLDLDAEGRRLATLRSITLVAGTDDAYAARSLDAQVERLHAAGLPARVVRFDGGHVLDDATLTRVAREVERTRGATPPAP